MRFCDHCCRVDVKAVLGEKIQNLERRNSEDALIESRRELESQRRQLLGTNQWADQAQRERIHLCSVFSRNATQEVAKKLKN